MKPRPMPFLSDLKESVMGLLGVGDVIVLTGDHKVYTIVPKHFLYTNKRGCWDLEQGLVVLDGEFKYLRGKYIVTKTEVKGGGGTGNQSYPDGHHVTCESLCGSYEVCFYQSGCFTAVNKDIEPVGKARIAWQFIDSE